VAIVFRSHCPQINLTLLARWRPELSVRVGRESVCRRCDRALRTQVLCSDHGYRDQALLPLTRHPQGGREPPRRPLARARRHTEDSVRRLRPARCDGRRQGRFLEEGGASEPGRRRDRSPRQADVITGRGDPLVRRHQRMAANPGSPWSRMRRVWATKSRSASGAEAFTSQRAICDTTVRDC